MTLNGCQKVGAECTTVGQTPGVVSGVFSQSSSGESQIGIGDCVAAGTSCNTNLNGKSTVGVVSGDPATSGACVIVGTPCSTTGGETDGVISASGSCKLGGSQCTDVNGNAGVISSLPGFAGECLAANACLGATGTLGFSDAQGNCVPSGTGCHLPTDAAGVNGGVTNSNGDCVAYGSSCPVVGSGQW